MNPPTLRCRGPITCDLVKPSRFRRRRWHARCSTCGYVWRWRPGADKEPINGLACMDLINEVAFYGHDSDGCILDY